MKLNRTIKVLIAIVLCQAAGALGAMFVAPEIPTWYAALQKPSFSPPNWLFGPAWFMWYTLMGIALYLVWQKGVGHKAVRFAVWFFCAHLFFNAIWSILFFGLHNPFVAFIDIVFLWCMIVALIVQFWKIRKWAAWLLIPYLLWVSFASVLNFSVWLLNR